MKNFLWFLHKPTDEREQALYHVAYQRVLFFLLGLFLIFSLFTGFFSLGEHTFSAPVWILDLGVDLVFLVCIFLGWNVVRKEELESLSQKVTQPQRISLILGSLVLVLVVGLTLGHFFPAWFLLIYMLTALLSWIVISIFSWYSLQKSIPVLLRVYLTILYPLFVLVFSRLPSKITVWKFISSSILGFFLHILLFLTITFGFLFATGTPYYVSTNAFAPELPQGERILATKSFGSLAVNDFIVFLGPTGETEGGTTPTIGKIMQVEPMLKVQTSRGEMAVDPKDILGKRVEQKFSLSKKFFGVLGMPTVTTDGVIPSE